MKPLACALVTLIMVAGPAQAGTDPQGYLDKPEWEADVGAFTTIDFTGFSEGTIITDQYQDQGVTFFNGIDTIRFNPSSFPNDDWGLAGNGDIWMEFDEPMHWIGADWPGGIFQIVLYRDGELLSSTLGPGEFIGNFLGLYSPEPFDVAVLSDPSDNAVFIDDLFFAVPTPAGIVVLILPLFRTRRRRT